MLATRALLSRSAAFAGLSLFFPSVVLLVLAQTFRSMPLLLIGTACSGAAAALGYRGSLTVINEKLDAHHAQRRRVFMRGRFTRRGLGRLRARFLRFPRRDECHAKLLTRGTGAR